MGYIENETEAHIPMEGREQPRPDLRPDGQVGLDRVRLEQQLPQIGQRCEGHPDSRLDLTQRQVELRGGGALQGGVQVGARAAEDANRILKYLCVFLFWGFF